MSVGKLITLFLIDGVPDGRLSAEISNWTGKAVKIPRKLVKESSDREEISNAGVYFLFGQSEEEPDSQAVYIGEGEEAYRRIGQQLKQEFWNEVVVFISKDENFNKAHIKYLESKLYDLAKKANRYKVVNSTIPTCPRLSEAEQSVMTGYLSNLKILLNALGYRVLDQLADKVEKRKDLYHINAARGANGIAAVTNEGVVVLEGSEIATKTVPSMAKGFKSKRDKLIEQRIIIEKEGKLVFSKDYLFSSPSTAAAIVMGRNANGRIEWKDKKGRTIKDNE